MAVEDYQPISLLPCIDNDNLADAFESIDALKSATDSGQVDISCRSVSRQISGATADGVQCVTLLEEGDFPSIESGFDKCFYILHFLGAWQFFGTGRPPIASYMTGRILCDGEPVESFSVVGGTSRILELPCDPSSKLEVCIDAYVSTYGGGAEDPDQTSADYSVSVQGCVFCINRVERDTEAFLCPPTIKPECCYGQSAIRLLIQNLNTLCQAFVSGGYQARCIRVSGSGEQQVFGPTTSRTHFLALGCASVQITGGILGDRIRFRIAAGCESGQSSHTWIYSYDDDTNLVGDQSIPQCLEIPVTLCGECPLGETISIGLLPDNDCTPRPSGSQQLGVEIEYDFCVWLFEELTNDNLKLIPQLGRCLTMERIEGIQDKAELIHEAACNIATPNCTIRDFNGTGDSLSGSNTLSVTSLIQQAQTPNPPIPPGTLKKWYVIGSISASFATGGGDEGRGTAMVSYQITCGGQIIKQSKRFRWVYQQSGFQTNQSPDFSICGCIECDILEDLEITVTVEQFQGPSGTHAISTIFTGGAICF